MRSAPETHSPVRVAIVGAGVIAGVHARAIIANSDLTLAAVVVRSPRAAQTLIDLATEQGAPTPTIHTNVADAVAEGSELVVIATPSGTHLDVAAAAIEAGAHVLIEKPVEISLPRARRLLRLSERTDRVVSVVSQHRWDPASIAVGNAIQTGRFGRITSATATVAWWRPQDYYDSGQWRGTWALDGGGALMNQGIHSVDLLMHFLGKPIEVIGRSQTVGHIGIEVEDVAAGVVQFESGAVATLLATTAAYPHVGMRLQLHGTRGSAVIDNDRLEYFAAPATPDPPILNTSVDEVPSNELSRGPVSEEPDIFDGHKRHYVAVARAIRDGGPPPVSVAEAVTAFAVVRAVYLSNKVGRWIPVEAVVAGEFDGVDNSPSSSD